jgi:hypothetical protein
MPAAHERRRRTFSSARINAPRYFSYNLQYRKRVCRQLANHSYQELARERVNSRSKPRDMQSESINQSDKEHPDCEDSDDRCCRRRVEVVDGKGEEAYEGKRMGFVSNVRRRKEGACLGQSPLEVESSCMITLAAIHQDHVKGLIMDGLRGRVIPRRLFVSPAQTPHSQISLRSSLYSVKLDVPIELWRTFLGTSYRSHHPPPLGPTFSPPSPPLAERATPLPFVDDGLPVLVPLEREVRPFKVVELVGEAKDEMPIDDGEEVDMFSRVSSLLGEGFDRGKSGSQSRF